MGKHRSILAIPTVEQGKEQIIVFVSSFESIYIKKSALQLDADVSTSLFYLIS